MIFEANLEDPEKAILILQTAFQEDLGVTINPRFGVLEEGKIVEPTGGVVEFLEEGGADASADAGTPPGPLGDPFDGPICRRLDHRPAR